MEDPAATLETRVGLAQPDAPKSSKVFAYCIIEEKIRKIGGYHFEGVDQAGLDRYYRKNLVAGRAFNFAIVTTEVNGICLEDALFNLVNRVTAKYESVYNHMSARKKRKFNLDRFVLILRDQGYTVSYSSAPKGKVDSPVTTADPLVPVVK
ncbi:TPA: hypothetical protein HA246_05415 [Candidatus Woesearchaeota archaeon]|nr:hypothetical protein [Candidatus Woesearchaeota archaeon]